MPRLPLALLLAGACALPPLQAGAMPADIPNARCSVTAKGAAVQGPCHFTARAGGSFTLQMTDGQTMGGAGAVMVDLKDGAATASGAGEAWGAVSRDPSDPACWVGSDLRICARAGAPEEGDDAATATAATAEELPVGFAGRCHMDACTWYQQSPPREIGPGSAAIPGRRVAVLQSTAITEHPGAAYPANAPADTVWDKPAEAQYFCSMTRPAARMDDGSWTPLPLPEVFGATEAITNAYLHACHPDITGPDPYETPKQLGYRSSAAPAAESYPDFEALIRP